MFATNEIPMAVEIHALFPGEEQGGVATEQESRISASAAVPIAADGPIVEGITDQRLL